MDRANWPGINFNFFYSIEISDIHLFSKNYQKYPTLVNYTIKGQGQQKIY